MRPTKSTHLNPMAQKSLVLRAIHEEECRILWEWSNDSIVRRSAFHSGSISWEEHKKWFATKLGDPNCYIFMALDGLGKPIGQIRFDVSGDRAETDISVVREKRSHGFGQQIIKSGVAELCKQTFIHSACALVKIENIASIRAFQKAGFKAKGEKTECGCRCVCLTLSINQNE